MITLGELEELNRSSTDERVVDDAETNDVQEVVNYRITSYGVDFDVVGLVRRMDNGSIFVPDFQRGYVWTQRQASQFVESLLLGLPVPGIFLAQEAETEKLMVIDGHQRLQSLQYFYAGNFGAGQRDFALQGVDPSFEGLKYLDLSERDRNRLDNFPIHATITRQLFPEDGMSSVFHIFQRLNSFGQRLTQQEIRQALYRGALLDCINELNDNPDWRNIFGPENRRQKDKELILRFWALYLKSEEYEAPMLKFLNTFVENNRNPTEEFLGEGSTLFTRVVQAFNSALGIESFRTKSSKQLNAAVFDSMAVGLARSIRDNGFPDPGAIKSATDELLGDPEYISSVSGGTAQPASVRYRIEEATRAFGDL